MRPLQIALRVIILALVSAGSLSSQPLIYAGDYQTATVTTDFSQPLEVYVGGACTTTCVPTPVVFTVANNDLMYFCTPLCNAATSVTILTLPNTPYAVVSVHAGTKAGSYTVGASAFGSTVYFHLTNSPGPLHDAIAVGGTPQSTPLRTYFSSPLQAKAIDAYGNPLAGVWILFEYPTTHTANVSYWAGSGCGSYVLTNVVSCEVLTDSNGIAAATPVAGATAGSGNVAAVALFPSGGAVGTALFTLTNVPGPLVTMTVNTSPSGVQSIDVDRAAGPGLPGFSQNNTTYSDTWAPGTVHEISASSQYATADGGAKYNFANWSDGGPITHSITLPATNTTYTANYNAQYRLNLTAGAGGSVSPSSGQYYSSGATVSITASPAAGYLFSGWIGTGPGSYSGMANPANVTMNGAITETAQFGPSVPVTVDTSPTGLKIRTSDYMGPAPHTQYIEKGGYITIQAYSPQSGAAGTQYVFANWSDGGAQTHTVYPPFTPTTYTANFTTQYLLTMTAGSGGGVSPPGGYYDQGSTVSIAAAPNSGYVFAGWTGTGSGSYTGTANAATVTMNGPITETAAFTQNTTGVTVSTSPSGLSFTVDGTTYTSSQNFPWTPGSQHTISTTPTQSGATGTQYVFTNWSDNGQSSHAVTAPSAATTCTANFTTQYLLTATAGSGGSVSPSGGQWYNAGSVVPLSATPNPGYEFTGWSGDVSGTANPQSVTMNYPCNVTASFAPAAGGVPSVVSTDPAFGGLASQNFTFQFSHSAGYQNLSVLDVLINNFLDGRHACYVAYVLSSNTLVLVDDAGDAGGPYAGSVAVGSQTVIQNSQCAVGLTSAIGSGNTFTLALSIIFKPAFGGNKIQYLAARDGSGNNSDWQAMGVWQAPPGPSGVITVGGVSPARGAAAAGTAQTLTLSVADSKGAGDFGVVDVLVNNFIDGRHACYLAYVAAGNTLYLVDDGGDAGGPYAGGMVMNGSAGTIQNSQCSVSGTGSLAQLGATLMLTLNITFQPGFAGNRVVWAAGRDAAGGNNTDWQAMGTWTVQ